jgi:hypothetical protein
MEIPAWLTISVAVLVIVFGLFRIRLGFRTAVQEEQARRRGGVYGMPRRTQVLMGIVYCLAGAALIATTFGWRPFEGFLGR